MLLSEFDFELPENLVARYPLPERSHSRLLQLNPQQDTISHRLFYQLPDFLRAGDCLILNDTRVFPARIFGTKASKGRVEILIERLLGKNEALAHLRAGKRPKLGSILTLDCQVDVKVVGFEDDLVKLHFYCDHSLLELLQRVGEIPLPPYLERAAEKEDFVRYNTVYGKHEGSCAAPTAGLHFDTPLLEKIQEKGISIGYVTLHVGAGTFQPVRTENITEHQLHAEYRVVPQETCDLVLRTKAAGGRVIAVGTTAVRSLESACVQGELTPCQGDTRLFIYPGFNFRCIDAMITNFHLPKTSLLMLICAFAGKDFILKAYKNAVSNGYRFYSYGDAMFIENAKSAI